MTSSCIVGGESPRSTSISSRRARRTLQAGSSRSMSRRHRCRIRPRSPMRSRFARPIPHEEAARIAEELFDVLCALPVERAGSVEDFRAGRVTAIVHMEGAEPIASDLSNLERWYERGLRSIGLVWSRPNDFAEGVPFRFPSSPDTGGGLTEAGRASSFGRATGSASSSTCRISTKPGSGTWRGSPPRHSSRRTQTPTRSAQRRATCSTRNSTRSATRTASWA